MSVCMLLRLNLGLLCVMGEGSTKVGFFTFGDSLNIAVEMLLKFGVGTSRTCSLLLGVAGSL